MKAERLLPCIRWLRDYQRDFFSRDLIAALIVTVMLVPQSLAYALLAGLPAEVGLYASILPLVAYALFGTSRTLSVGPVAVLSLMTASAIQGLGLQSQEEMIAAAIVLAMLSGLFLLVLGLLRFGFLANFLSHPVVAGFITSSALLIALSQLKHLLGIQADGDTLPHLLDSLWQHLPGVHLLTLALGTSCLLLLYLGRRPLVLLLQRLGLSKSTAQMLSKTSPMLVVVLSIAAVWAGGLDQQGVRVVGHIPAGLPSFQWPSLEASLWQQLALSAVLLSIIGYVESVSVGRTLAAKRRQKIDPDQELIGLGMANCSSALSGGLPVTGGFSRSVVNYDAGAQTQLASLLTAVGITLVSLTLTGALFFLPQATLAATIIVAVLSLVDFSVLPKSWRYSRSDFAAVSLTIVITLLMGVEMGVLFGVVTAIGLHLYKTSRPHIAVLGHVAGTEHYRNVTRYKKATTHPWILSLRMDESLYFANAAVLEETVLNTVADRDQLRHVILMCSPVNEIDLSALEVLEGLNERLHDLGIGFHLSEVKGPVMDQLNRSHFLEELHGQVFMTHHQAVEGLIAEEMEVTTPAEKAPSAS